ncbi:MAG: hypothetical protein AB2A00_24980 [Myxococcota bacterium]
MLRRVLLLVLTAFLGACPEPGDVRSFERQAEVDRAELTLGPTRAGIPVQGVVRMRNRAEDSVRASVTVEPAGDAFTVLTSEVSAGRDWVDIPVQLLSFTDGTFEGTLRLSTNSTGEREFTVRLRGVVNPPPDCNDDNPCTLDLLENDTCYHTPVSGACDDGSLCTVEDRCVNGQCTGELLDCGDGVGCTVDTCDPALGCVHVPRVEDCSDGNPCTQDLCNPVTGCANVVSPNGTLCGPPACSALPLCVDGDCRALPAPDGFPCEDGDPCSIGDTCRSGVCEKGVGEEMGVADPVVVGAMSPSDVGVTVEPVEVGGIQPMESGVVRVVWRSAPLGVTRCPDGSCDNQDPSVACNPTLRATHGGHAIQVTDVDSEGNVLRRAELAAPHAGDAAVAVRASNTSRGIAVVAQFRSRPSCECEDTSACPPARIESAFYLVATDGTVQGPQVLATVDEDPLLGPGWRLPIALGVNGDTAVALGSVMGLNQCDGQCPNIVRLLLHRVNLASSPPALGAVREVRVIVGATSDALSDVQDVSVMPDDDEATLVWRVAGGSVNGLACGPVDGRPWQAVRWNGALENGISITDQQLLALELTHASGVTVAADALGPVTFLGERTVTTEPCTCDGGPCPTDDAGSPCVTCVVQERLTSQQGSGGELLWERRSEGGSAAMMRLTSGAAFGRAVGVAVLADGTVGLASPPLATSPLLTAEFTPPEGFPVHVLPQSPAVLEPFGTRAYVAALMGVDLGPWRLNTVALVQAGCGLQPTGTIKGWQWPDAGHPVLDAGTSDGATTDGSDGGDTDAGSMDGGSSPDAGTDGGDLVDAAVLDAGVADGGTGGSSDGGVRDGGVADGGIDAGAGTDAGGVEAGVPSSGP